MAAVPVVETIFDTVIDKLRIQASGGSTRYWFQPTVYEGAPDEVKLGKASYPCLWVDRSFNEDVDGRTHPSSRRLNVLIRVVGYVRTNNNRRDVVRLEHDLWEALNQIGSIAGCSSAGVITDLDLADDEIGIAKKGTGDTQARSLVSVFTAEVTYKTAETTAA